MKQIFISYSEKDSIIAKKIEVALIEKGYEVWRDKTDIHPGDNFINKIEDAIHQCDIVLLLWSKDSTESKWINSERTAATKLGKFIIPCILDETALPLFMDTSQHIDLRNFSQGLNNLIDSLKDFFKVKVDWGDCPDVSVFFGRTTELKKLKHLILDVNCRLVAVVGFGGIGKTALTVQLTKGQQSTKKGFGFGGIGKSELAAKLVEGIKDEFDYVIWKWLINSPGVEDVLKEILKFLSEQKDISLPDSVDNQIIRLIDYLQKNRCLLILDNMESVLEGGENKGEFKEGFEDYGTLIRKIAETEHQSCLLITSRITPRIVDSNTATNPVKICSLGGIAKQDVISLFDTTKKSYWDNKESERNDKQWTFVEQDWENIVSFYDGNPLALKLVASHILSVFDGNITAFMNHGEHIPEGIDDLLQWHFSRLSDLQKEIMYWLAINRIPTSINTLEEDIVSSDNKNRVARTIQKIKRDIPLETSGICFTMQPVILEYITAQFVVLFVEEFKNNDFLLCNNHPILKALDQNYIRESQRRLILRPIKERLIELWGNRNNLERKLHRILDDQRKNNPLKRGYITGNIINLLLDENNCINGFNFSNLTIWQGYFQGVELHDVNFSHCEIDKSVFTGTFGRILSIAFSSDGSYLAGGAANGEIRLWRTKDGEPVDTYLSTDFLWAIDFHPDGKLISCAGIDRIIQLWDIQNGQCVKTLKGHTNQIRAAVFSPDKKLFASGGGDHTIMISDIKSSKRTATLKGHKGWLAKLAFNSDGTLLASASEDKTVKIWDVKTGECLNTFTEHTDIVRSVVFCSDTLCASGGNDNKVIIWEVDTLKCVQILDHQAGVCALSYNSSKKILASGGYEKWIMVWSVEDGKLLKSLEGHTDWIRALAFNPKNNTLASGSDDQSIRLWDTELGECTKIMRGYTEPVYTVKFSNHSNIIGSAGDTIKVRLWDFEGKNINVLESTANRLRSLIFSPDDNIVACASEDQTIRIWYLKEKKCYSLQGHTHQVFSVAFNSKGNKLVSGCSDLTLRVWDVNNRHCVQIIEGAHDDRIRAVAWSPNDRFLASGGYDKIINLWDANNGEHVRIIGRHKNAIWSLVFNSNSNVLISGSDDHTVRLWDVDSGVCIKTLKGHTGGVVSVALNQQNTLIASSGIDRVVRIWDVATGNCIKTLRGHERAVRSVDFNPDGRLLVSGSDDETIKLWNVDTGEYIENFLPERPYERLNITQIKGITSAQKAALLNLGAIEGD